MRIIVAILTLAVSSVLFATSEVSAEKPRILNEAQERESQVTQKPTSQRQTPKTDFGLVLKEGVPKEGVQKKPN